MEEKFLLVVVVEEEKYYQLKTTVRTVVFFSIEHYTLAILPRLLPTKVYKKGDFEVRWQRYHLVSQSGVVSMNKQYRIKKNEEFQEIFQKGASTANRQFVIYVLDQPDQTSFKIGLSVSKKIGNAVIRNRVKRLIRQVMFEYKDYIKVGKDIVIIARRPTAEMDYYEVKSSLEHVCKRAKILNRPR
jgi:ribonuclease P protein component